jgi:ADP-dependent NAD(P)H-hydrate dehydratase / NAD(P)H-hydrate epimerase
MTEPLAETPGLSPSARAGEAGRRQDVIAMGPGLGRHPETTCPGARAVAEFRSPWWWMPMRWWLAGTQWRARPAPRADAASRRNGAADRQDHRGSAADRVGTARGLATERAGHVVLKGERTLIAFPDGRVWINPTGTPAMGTGGTGDVLTGMIAGFLAQFPKTRTKPWPPPSICTAWPANWRRALGEKS